MKTKDKKVCSKCKIEKSINEFRLRNKLKGWRHSECNLCHKSFTKPYYQKYKKDYLARNKARRDTIYGYILAYKLEHPCEICGESEPVCLDFHHLRDKKFNISEATYLLSLRNIEELKNEIAKCQILCSNCHRKVHNNKL